MRILPGNFPSTSAFREILPLSTDRNFSPFYLTNGEAAAEGVCSTLHLLQAPTPPGRDCRSGNRAPQGSPPSSPPPPPPRGQAELEDSTETAAPTTEHQQTPPLRVRAGR